MSLNSSLDAWGTEDAVEEYGKRAAELRSFVAKNVTLAPSSPASTSTRASAGSPAPPAPSIVAPPPSCATKYTTSFAAGKRLTFKEIREKAEAEARMKERNRLLQRKLMQAEAKERLAAKESERNDAAEAAKETGTKLKTVEEKKKKKNKKVTNNVRKKPRQQQRQQARAGSNPNAAAITPPVPRRTRGRIPIVGIKIRDPLSASKRKEQAVIERSTPGCVESGPKAPTPGLGASVSPETDEG